VPWRRALGHAALVALARVVTSVACLLSGFRAVSDDDYSRVAIAAHFAHHPSPDPSGTSWLPLPFWLYGVPMALFGDSLSTARVVAVLLGAAAAVLVWLAGKWLGLSERAALGGALGAVLLPYGAWLSVATVPEAPTAALVLLGAVSLLRPETKLRAVGGLALGAACFCRYESWAPALLFSAVSAWDAVRERRRELWWPVLFSAAPIGLWLLHGIVRHGDALFFVSRVRQYSAALGGVRDGFLASLVKAPLAIARFEPELFLLALVALALSFRRGQSPFGAGAWRPLAMLGSLVALLVAADLSGGAATHHPERSLLPVFWFLALVTAGLLVRLAEHPRRWLLPVVALPLALAASVWLRPNVRQTFVERSDEERVGKLLRLLDARHVALDTDDFGFFAVQAALGDERSFALRAHDPRRPDPPLPASSAELARRLQARGAAWLVQPRARSELGRTLGPVPITTERFSVVRLEPEKLRAMAAAN
jgi:hypothetical protein